MAAGVCQEGSVLLHWLLRELGHPAFSLGLVFVFPSFTLLLLWTLKAVRSRRKVKAGISGGTILPPECLSHCPAGHPAKVDLSIAIGVSITEHCCAGPQHTGSSQLLSKKATLSYSAEVET